jgi:hypothetical protein
VTSTSGGGGGGVLGLCLLCCCRSGSLFQNQFTNQCKLTKQCKHCNVHLQPHGATSLNCHTCKCDCQPHTCPVSSTATLQDSNLVGRRPRPASCLINPSVVYSVRRGAVAVAPTCNYSVPGQPHELGSSRSSCKQCTGQQQTACFAPRSLVLCSRT